MPTGPLEGSAVSVLFTPTLTFPGTSSLDPPAIGTVLPTFTKPYLTVLSEDILLMPCYCVLIFTTDDTRFRCAQEVNITDRGSFSVAGLHQSGPRPGMTSPITLPLQCLRCCRNSMLAHAVPAVQACFSHTHQIKQRQHIQILSQALQGSNTNRYH